MALAIRLSKAEAAKLSGMDGEVRQFCERVLERDDHVLYVPFPGKMVDIIKVLWDNRIAYDLKNEPVD